MQSQKQILKTKFKNGQISKKEYDASLRAMGLSKKKTNKGPKISNVKRQQNALQSPRTNIDRPFRNSNGAASYARINYHRDVLERSDKLPPIVRDFLKMQIDPHTSVSVRRPESANILTALYHSIMELPLTLDFGGTPSVSSNFGIVVQPKLGNINATVDGEYKISYFSWPGNLLNYDLANPNTFWDVLGGRDPRVDPNIGVLTSPPPSSYQAHFDNTSTHGFFYTITEVNAETTHNLVVTYPSEYSFKVAPGLYNVIIFVDSNSSGTFSSTVNPVVSGGSLTPAVYDNPGTYKYWDMSSTNNTRFYNFILYALTDATVTISTSMNGANFTTDLIVDAIALGRWTPPPDYGVIKKMRPIAMSTLLTYTGSTLNNAGNVAAANIPADALMESVFTNVAGNYLNWSNLAMIPGAFNSRLSEGAYIWWTPQSTGDTLFMKPSDCNSYQYPSFILSGSYTHNTPITGTLDIGRIIVDTVFEYTTTSTAFETKSVYGSQNTIDLIQNITHTAPRVMSNPDHIKFLLDWAKRLTNFISRNSGNIGLIARTVGTML